VVVDRIARRLRQTSQALNLHPVQQNDPARLRVNRAKRGVCSFQCSSNLRSPISGFRSPRSRYVRTFLPVTFSPPCLPTFALSHVPTIDSSPATSHRGFAAPSPDPCPLSPPISDLRNPASHSGVKLKCHPSSKRHRSRARSAFCFMSVRCYLKPVACLLAGLLLLAITLFSLASSPHA
jgi:hypothetical protein